MNLRSRFSRPILLATLVSLALPCAACAPPVPTIEEAGGYRVTYALPPAKEIDHQMTVTALQRRLDAFGAVGSKVAKHGQDQIVITLPGIDPQKFEQLRKLLVTPGKLEFRILAQEGTHDALIAAATAPASSPEDEPQRDQPKDDPAKDDPAKDEASTKTRWVRFDPASLELTAGAIQRTVDKQSEVLIVLDPHNVDNRLLASVSAEVDSASRPAISGRFTPEGGKRMRALTTDNAPKGTVYQILGVVLDDRLLVAPRIVEPIGAAFMVTGKFTQPEVEFMQAVLRTGRLPVELDPQPVKVEQVDAPPGQ